MTPDDLADRLRAILLGWGFVVPDGAMVLRPLVEEPGWWASPVVLRLAASGGTTPTPLAERLVAALAAHGVDARVSGPGFVEACLGLDLPDPPRPDSSVIHKVFHAEPERTNPGPSDSSAIHKVFHAEQERTNRVGVAPPVRWVIAATAPRTLRDPENPLLLVQLAHSRLVRRASCVGRRTADARTPKDAVRHRWVVVRAAWELPRFAERALETGDPDPLAALLEEAARVGLAADELADDEVAVLVDLLAKSLRLLSTAAPERI